MQNNFYSKTNYGVLVNGVNVNRPNCVVLKVLEQYYDEYENIYIVKVRFACNGNVAIGFISSQEASLVLTGYNFHLDSVSSFKLVKQ